MTARIVLATHNTKKVSELRAILAETSRGGTDGANRDTSELWDVTSGLVTSGEIGAPEPIEDGVTFAENALLKARAVCASTGLPAIADDSGLVVDVLGGAPGIFSARWAGRHGDDLANLELLLAQLSDVRSENRQAGFVCAAALVTPHGREEVRTGEMRGVLETVPRGEGGFGYDPILVPHDAVLGLDGRHRTAAELDPDEKNAISHRGQAFRALAPVILEVLGS